jgi:hypothetical protein
VLRWFVITPGMHVPCLLRAIDQRFPKGRTALVRD